MSTPKRVASMYEELFSGLHDDPARHLEVTFAAVGAQTLATLDHSGWEGYDDPVAARHDYNQGWPRMLGLYRRWAEFRPGDVA